MTIKPTLHCQKELEQDLGYKGFLPDSLLMAWANDRYSTSKHLLTLYSIARGLNAKTIVEVGFGRSSFVLARAAHENDGRLLCCDMNNFAHLLSQKEVSVTNYIHSNSRDVWSQISGNVDFAFLDHFEDCTLSQDFIINEISQCVSKMKTNGVIAIGNAINEKSRVSYAIREISKRSDIECACLPYSYGLAIIRFTGESSAGKIHDMHQRKYDIAQAPLTPQVIIPFSELRTLKGGPKTFMTHLEAGLKILQFPWIEPHQDTKDAKSIFFPINYNIELLSALKKRGIRIIQRLDGVYYPSQHGESYKELNKKIEYIYKNLVDTVIFQSQFSKLLCQEIMGLSCASQEFIIHNGTDTSIFYPNPNKISLSELPIFLTTGHIRSIAQIKPIVEALDSFDHPKKLIIAGQVNDEFKDYLKRDYIEHKQQLEMKQVAELLRTADVFLYSCLNPNCANSVIEAISSGLPVVGYDTGSMKEICHHSAYLLAHVSNDVIQVANDFSPTALLDKIKICVEDYGRHLECAREHCSDFPILEMTKRYVEVFWQ